MRVSFARVGGRVPPPDNDGVQIDDDGHFSMWRSIAPVIGRFAGTLTDTELSGLQAEAKAAASAGDFTKPPYPEGAVDLIDLDGAHASLGSNDAAEGAWVPLLGRLRRLLDELIDEPRAAIALRVSDDGRSARLEHLGDTAIDLDLSRLSVRAVLWGRGYRKLGDWTADVAGGQRVSAAGAWSMALPLDHGFRTAPDRVVHVYATFAATENGQRADVRAQHTPPVPE